MLKKTVTYTDFEGNEVTEDLYFNLSKSEMITLEARYKGGLELNLAKMVADGDQAQMVEEFKSLLLMMYGERSADGKRFMKTPEITENFKYSAAFDAVFFEILTSEEAITNFLKGVLPKEAAEAIDQGFNAAVQATLPAPTVPSS